MNAMKLYDILDKMFVLHTTRVWKNGWQHEGDRLSTELTVQKQIMWNNLFLLRKESRGFNIEGPNGFKLEVENEFGGRIRIDIESHMSDINIYYYVDNDLDWSASMTYIIDLCKTVYDSNVHVKEIMSEIPSLYGSVNPKFTLEHKRDLILKDMGI